MAGVLREVLDAAVQHVLALLRASARPLSFTLIVPALEFQKGKPDYTYKVFPNVDTRWNFTIHTVINLLDDYHPVAKKHLVPGKKKEFDRSEPEL